MYLCFVDESGTHGSSPVLVVGGIIVHEEDAWHLQQRLDSFLFNKLHPLRHDHTDFELHATELRRGSGQASGRTTATGSWRGPTVRWLATPP